MPGTVYLITSAEIWLADQAALAKGNCATSPSYGISRVGELSCLAGIARCFRFGEQPGVERGEIVLGHIDIAAHLEHVRRAAVQPRGNVADGADIGGDVLADRALARVNAWTSAPFS